MNVNEIVGILDSTYNVMADYNNLLVIVLIVLGYVLKVTPIHNTWIPLILCVVGGLVGSFLFTPIVVGLSKGIAFAGIAIVVREALLKRFGIEKYFGNQVEKIQQKIVNKK